MHVIIVIAKHSNSKGQKPLLTLQYLKLKPNHLHSVQNDDAIHNLALEPYK